MKRTPRLLLTCFLTVLFALSAFSAVAARPPQMPDAGRYVPGEVLIGWAPGRGPVQAVRPPKNTQAPDAAQADWQAATQQVAAETGLPVLDARPDYGTARLKVREGREAAEIARLSALPWVQYAEPNYIAYAADAGGLYPNDPDFGLQWNMHRVAAPEAWAVTRGSLSFVVAVLDTGVARSHPEFAGRLLEGKNYVNNGPPEDDDPESHGTHVTGIIAANMNNGMGVAGLAPDVKILPYKVLRGADRQGPYSAISTAIRDAANNQAQVINMSLVGYEYSQTLHDAVNYAISRGSLIVAAAGNCPPNTTCDSGSPTAYPAAFPGVLAVGASDRFDQPAPYAIPKPYVGIAAPGGTVERGVWSATRFGYGYLRGTSMSAPTVSAAAALAWTLRPGASPGDIAELLKNTADKTGTFAFSGEPLPYAGGRNDYFGAGRLNVAAAVRQAYPPTLIGPGWQNFLVAHGSSQDRSVQVENLSGQAVWWQASTLEGSGWLSVSPGAGALVHGAPAELTLRVDATALPPGSYFGRVRLTSLTAGVAPLDIPVQLSVASSLTRAHLPLTGAGFSNNWRDPDAPGSLYRLDLNVANNGAVALFLPFPVAFYGAPQQLIYASENGLIAFGQGNAPLRPPATCPGNGAAPNNALYAFAADWVADGGASVVIHQPDADTYVITWQNVRLNGTAERATFQLVITRRGEFQANYLSLANPRAGIIGSENDDGTVAERILCLGAGRPAPQSGSITFAPRLPWQ